MSIWYVETPARRALISCSAESAARFGRDETPPRRALIGCTPECEVQLVIGKIPLEEH